MNMAGNSLFILFLVLIIHTYHTEQQRLTTLPWQTTPTLNAIIHIGPHKTASTYIQHTLTENRNTFLKHNYTVVLPSRKAGAVLAFTLKAQKNQVSPFPSEPYVRMRDVYNGMVSQIQSKTSSIILSSEEFDDFTPETVRLLADLLQNYTVTIVAFHRERSKLFRSYWEELNKFKPCPERFGGFYRRHVPPNVSLPSVEMEGTLDAFADAFGAGNVRLISFDGVMSSRRNIMAVFIKDILGLAVGEGFSVSPHEDNTSPNPIIYELKAEVCDYMRDHNMVSFLNFINADMVRAIQYDFPQKCVVMDELGTYFQKQDDRLFAKYGKPLYYSDDLTFEKMCTLDSDTIRDDPTLGAFFLKKLIAISTESMKGKSRH